MSDVNTPQGVESEGMTPSNEVSEAKTGVSDDVQAIRGNPEAYANTKTKAQEEQKMHKALKDSLSGNSDFRAVVTYMKGEVVDAIVEEGDKMLPMDSYRRWVINYIANNVTAEQFLKLADRQGGEDFNVFMSMSIGTTTFGEGFPDEMKGVIDKIFKGYRNQQVRRDKHLRVAVQELKNMYYFSSFSNLDRQEALKKYFGI